MDALLSTLELPLALNSIAISTLGGLLLLLLLFVWRPHGTIVGSNGNKLRRPPIWWRELALFHAFTEDKPRQNCAEDFGRPESNVWRCFFLCQPCVLVTGAANVRAALMAPHETLKGYLPSSTMQILGERSIVRLHGKEHTRERRILQAAFTPSNLRGYVPRLTALAETILMEWAERGRVLLFDESRRYVTRVASDVLAGFDERWTSPEGYAKVNQCYLDIWKGFFSIPLNFPGSKLRTAITARETIERLVDESLSDFLRKKEEEQKISGCDGGGRNETQHEETFTGSTKKPQGRTIGEILAAMTDEDGKPLDTKRIASGCCALLLGAVDTTSTGLMMALWIVAKNPAIMEGLRQEQAEIMEKFGPDWTDEAVQAMKYADGVVKETFRLHSPAQIAFRRAAKDFELDDYLIKKGEIVMISLGHSMATDERWVSDAPEECKPERWLRPEGARSGAWVPFGGGLRFCLGWQLAMTEMRVFLAALARSNLDIELVDPAEKWHNFPLQKPVSGLPVKVCRRGSAA